MENKKKSELKGMLDMLGRILEAIAPTTAQKTEEESSPNRGLVAIPPTGNSWIAQKLYREFWLERTSIYKLHVSGKDKEGE